MNATASKHKHTPTPWVHTTHLAGDSGRQYNIVKYSEGGQTYRVIAKLDAGREMWEADGAFIVQAVNAHDELVAALELALSTLEVASADFEDDDEQGKFLADPIPALRAALAKAKGTT